MLVPGHSPSEADPTHGGKPVGLADLRRQLATPSRLQDGTRQRLSQLAQRLNRIRAMGNEYARLDLSEHVKAAMDRRPVTV